MQRLADGAERLIGPVHGIQRAILKMSGVPLEMLLLRWPVLHHPVIQGGFCGAFAFAVKGILAGAAKEQLMGVIAAVLGEDGLCGQVPVSALPSRGFFLQRSICDSSAKPFSICIFCRQIR